MGFHGGSVIKNPPVNAGLISGLERFPGGRNATQSSNLAWKIPWTQSLVRYNPWGCKESDTTEHTHNEKYTGVLRVLGSKLAALGLVI